MYSGVPGRWPPPVSVCNWASDSSVGLQDTLANRLVVIGVAPNLGNAPIQQNDFPEVSDPDVLWLDVAVDHAPGVRVGERLAGVCENFQATRRRISLDGCFVSAGDPLQNFKEVLTRNPLHDEVDALFSSSPMS